MDVVILAVIVVVVVLVVAGLVFFRPGRGTTAHAPDETPPTTPAGGTATAEAAEADDDTAAPEAEAAPAAPAVEIEKPPPSAGRLTRLRARLAQSQSVLGKGLLALLSRDALDDDAWEELEDLLITADVGVAPTRQIVDDLKTQVKVAGTREAGEVRELLKKELVKQIDPELDRTLRTERHDGDPAVLMIVGVNGTGKTTTCGKLGRVLVGDGRTVVLGAADTFRAAAADQLQTWGARVGAEVVRRDEGADPASVAFDAVSAGIDSGVDAVIVDTAGRLHTKTGLMDELGKVKRVIEKRTEVDEVLLVLDATTGQNGLKQARVFADVVNVTGIVLTKLDGTAKGGIVIQVQRELGVPVKLVGLGEGPDDLAPFEPDAFVDAILGD
ncbi:MAG TPA: signal recognition particle-docking protein FtsY [Streptosporangiaceae bacterium]|jgi:fused signal recognition particle receptor